MSDYRRWISYIYSYEHGEKKNNAGYARIELKDGRVKMTIYMTPGRKDGIVKVCFYKGQQGHLAGIPLGNLDLSVPSPVFRTETSASNIMDSGLFFVEMNGLLLVKEDGQYFASSWEEESLAEDVARDIIRLLNGKQTEKSNGKAEQPEGIRAETGRTEESKKKEKQIEKNEQEAGKAEAEKEEAKKEAWKTDDGKETVKTERKDETKKAQQKETQIQKEQQEDVPKTKHLKIAEIKEMANMAEGMRTQTEEGKKATTRKEEEKGTEEKGEECQTGNDAKTESCEKDNCGQENECGQESNCEQAAKPEKETRETKKTETTRLTETPFKNCCMGASPAERIFCCLPPMYPFEEAKYEKGVRMTPQDIGMLPRSLWKLAGNSFLLHAYYTYHHLLFVKQRQKDGPLYFLMLPGVYSEKEQNLALMFGFCNFCAAKRKALEQGDFGYWYLEVNF